MKRIRQLKKAFTLTELIVVVTILVLLLAIAAPAVSRSLQSAKVANSAANLQQIGQLMLAYAAENDGWLPLAEDSQESGGRVGWFRRLTDYAGIDRGQAAHRLFSAPAAPKRNLEDREYITSNYSANVAILGLREPHAPPVRTTAIHRPSRVILAATGPQVLWSNGTTAYMWDPWPFGGSRNPHEKVNVKNKTATDKNWGTFGPILNNKIGALMADGHAELLDPEDIRWGHIQNLE